MLKDISRATLTFRWVAAIIVLAAFAVVCGIDLTASNGELWLVACVAPPVVMLLVWRPETVTVAELLYAVNTPVEDAPS